MAQDSDTSEIRTVLQALREARKVDPGMSCASLEVFLSVALTPYTTSRPLQASLGVAQSSFSRCLGDLSLVKGGGEEGLDLVETYTDINDMRLGART